MVQSSSCLGCETNVFLAFRPMATLFEQPDGSESPLIPPGLSIVVSDSLEAAALFLVVQHVALALKAKRRCVLVGLANSYEHYTSVLRKQVRSARQCKN